MGYSTDFSGSLKISPKLDKSQKDYLKTFLGADCRDHKEWFALIPDWKHSRNLTYIDLELTDDEDALQWDGSEKTYDLAEKVELIIKLMRIKVPEFSLHGKLYAQGESRNDTWILRADGDVVVEETIDLVTKTVTCPNCQHHFNRMRSAIL